MGTAITASIAASNASIAASNAERNLQISKCPTVIKQYDSNHATVHEMQEYADCVNQIYPNEITTGEIIFLKVLFVSAIFGAIVMIWKEKQKYDRTISDYFIAGMLGLAIAPAIILTITYCLYGLLWLFNIV